MSYSKKLKWSKWVPNDYSIDDEFNCLTNAENLADKNSLLKFVVGFARFPLKQWGEHAWCEAPDGTIVDPYFFEKFGDRASLIEYKRDFSAFENSFEEE